MENTINHRIELLITKMGLNKNSFSNTIGQKAQTTHKIIKGINRPGYEYIAAIISTFADINPRWLLLGEGPETLLSTKPLQEIHSQFDDVNYDKRPKFASLLKENERLTREADRLYKENERLTRVNDDQSRHITTLANTIDSFLGREELLSKIDLLQRTIESTTKLISSGRKT